MFRDEVGPERQSSTCRRFVLRPLRTQGCAQFKSVQFGREGFRRCEVARAHEEIRIAHVTRAVEEFGFGAEPTPDLSANVGWEANLRRAEC